METNNLTIENLREAVGTSWKEPTESWGEPYYDGAMSLEEIEVEQGGIDYDLIGKGFDIIIWRDGSKRLEIHLDHAASHWFWISDYDNLDFGDEEGGEEGEFDTAEDFAKVWNRFLSL